MLTRIADPQQAPEVLTVRETIRAWRFYDHFRVDAEAPVRSSQLGTRTPVLANDGRDLAPALQTIREIGDREVLERTIEDAFPGSALEIEHGNGRFALALKQPGMLRALAASELSDGTLRFLLWSAALLTSGCFARNPRRLTPPGPARVASKRSFSSLAFVFVGIARFPRGAVTRRTASFFPTSSARICTSAPAVRE